MKLVARNAHFVVLLWTVLLASLIWHKASISNQLPITDAFEYFAKAKHFWDAIHSARPALALDAQPVFRPFGTVLMSYPFGFDGDPRPFYFRSVLYGIVLLMIAIFVATPRRRECESGEWAIFVALSASVLPMFYHFEASETNHNAPAFWGLVDGFFAGLSALAAASVVRAVARRSFAWTLVAIFAAAYSLLVKPTGAVVMLMTGAAWTTGVARAWLNEGKREIRREGFKFLVIGSIAFAAIFGSVLWWCMHSTYLSGTNMTLGSNAMTTLQSDWKNTLNWQLISGSLYPSIGIFLPLALILPPLFLVCVRRLPLSFWKTYSWHVAVAVITFGAGLWLWLISSNATQVRYLFPFALAALVFLLPPLEHAFSMASSWLKKASLGLFVVPVVATAVLLLVPSIPTVWQDRLGVNLDAGPVREEGMAASRLLEDIRSDRKKSGVTVYDLTMGRIPARDLASRASYEELVNSGKPPFNVVNATDWIPPSVLKTRELVDADYILVAPLPESERVAWLATEANDFQSEVMSFNAWGSELDAKDGVSTLVTGASVKLYKVQDRDKLELSLANFRGVRKWRAAFLEHNLAYWWSREQLDAVLQQQPSVLRNVSFDSIYKIEAVRVRHSPGVILLDVWWTGPPRPNASSPYRMFVHLQDGRNEVIQINASWLHERAPLLDSMPIRLSSFRFAATPNEAMSVALGIYDGTDKFLLADSGNRDWGNQRVVVSLAP